MPGQDMEQPNTFRRQERWQGLPPLLPRLCGFVIGLSLIIVGNSSLWAQPPKDFTDDEAPITVNPPRDRLQAMYEAATLAEREQFTAAAKVLQTVLDSPEDYFLEHDLQSTLKQQALTMLAGWPTAGREAYDRLYSADASGLWEQIQRTGSRADWSSLLSQYWMTPAGQAAATQWASHRIDAGEALSAGRLWSHLRQSPGGHGLNGDYSLREALAWELAGRPDLRQVSLEPFRQGAPGNPLTLGGKTFAGPEAIEQATNWLRAQVGARQEERQQRTVAMWTSPRGDVSRNAIALPAMPVGQPAWSKALLEEHCEPLLSKPSPYRRGIVRASVTELEERLYEEDRIAIPAVVPVINQQRVVIRTLSGLAAFDFATGALKWRSVVDSSLYRRLWNQLPDQPADAQPAPSAHPVLQQYLRERLYRDSLQGSLACNDQLVFAIESNLEVVVPAPRNVIRGTPEVPDPVNRLVAYDLQTGQLQWELGGPRGDHELPLAGHFFLGAPLVLGDTLYCLAESDSEQRLLQLQIDPETTTPRLIWSQVLVAPEQVVSRTVLRRLSGLTPTWADGLVLCPTGCGILVAVDPLRKQLAWGFQYPSLEPRPLNPRALMALRGNAGIIPVPVRPDEEHARWLDASPIYVRGMVLFTPRDASELICLDAVTGTERWRRPRGSALHVAGVQDDMIVVIGRSSVEALRFNDGELLWSVATPAPAGQGVLLPDRYLLPAAARQILTIDLTQGRILSYSQIDHGQENSSLIAAGGSILTVSTTALSRYATLSELEDSIRKSLAANVDDPVALALRGELHLLRGEQAAGQRDLRASLQQRSDARTASILAHSLLDGLRTDFAQFRSQAEEIDRLLADSPVRSEFLRTYAQALIDAGEPVAAFHQYLKLAEVSGSDERLERVTGGWSARGDRLVRGQVRALFQTSTPAQREAFDAAFAAFHGRSDGMGDAAVRERHFLRIFHPLPMLDPIRVSMLARTDDATKSERLTIARQLARAPRPEHAAAGVATVAQLLVEQQRFSEAGPWLDRLNGDLSNFTVSSSDDPAKLTGRELAAKLKQEFPAAPPSTGWGRSEILVERKARFASSARNVPVDVRGAIPDAWRNWTFEVTDAPKTVLAARDPNGQTRWKVDVLPQTGANGLQRFGASAAFHTLHITDDRMVLSLSGRFAVLDLTAGLIPVVRWQTDLVNRMDSTGAALHPTWRTDWLPCGRRRLIPTVMSEFADAIPSGQVLGVTDEVVCYTASGRLVAADLTTGRVLWVRLGVPQLVEGTANADYVTLLDIAASQAIVYRMEDGAEIAKRPISDASTWLWFEGERLLSVKSDRTGQVTARLEALASGNVLWEQEKLPVGTRFSLPDGNTLLRWTPPGVLQKLDLHQGAVLWSAKTPGVDEANLLRLEHFGDLELVFLGKTGQTLDSTRISLFDPNHLPFTGHILGLDPRSGTQKWRADISPMALDQQARPNLPLLPLVARQYELPQAGNAPGIPVIPQMRFAATFLDKRTGDVLYKTTETAQPQQYSLEVDEQQPRAVINFSSWSLEFRTAE